LSRLLIHSIEDEIVSRIKKDFWQSKTNISLELIIDINYKLATWQEYHFI